ncbi:YbdD/YjiX family protein [Streptomyces sp. V4I2]|uniref:YbdD/YjiX family protein n=1 Tax=Streptomyces sp. V4I2 TaxID=3042280 RepID=UPI0027D89AE4|nr:YbdD/YjiX family protein [Streptomyces sp. V4I2]
MSPADLAQAADESAYDGYVAHVRAECPQAPAPSRRDFERMRTERQEADPRQGLGTVGV